MIHFLIANIGTTLIIVSHDIASSFFAGIPGATVDPFTGYWGVPCQGVNKLSNITFRIGGVELSLTPEEYMVPTYLMRVSVSKSAAQHYSMLNNGVDTGLFVQKSTSWDMPQFYSWF